MNIVQAKKIRLEDFLEKLGYNPVKKEKEGKSNKKE